jgi:hypothetical protein
VKPLVGYDVYPAVLEAGWGSHIQNVEFFPSPYPPNEFLNRQLWNCVMHLHQ